MSEARKILDKSKTLFMRYGIKSVTMDDIARHLGMSKKTIYQHVNNKADLINKIMKLDIEEEEQVLIAIRQETNNAIEEMLRVSVHVGEKLQQINPSAAYDLKKYYPKGWELMRSIRHEHIYSIIKDNLSRGVKQGIYRENLNTEVLARFYLGQTELVFDRELFPFPEYKQSEVYLEFVKYHMRGIVSQKGYLLLEQCYQKQTIN